MSTTTTQTRIYDAGHCLDTPAETRCDLLVPWAEREVQTRDLTGRARLRLSGVSQHGQRTDCARLELFGEMGEDENPAEITATPTELMELARWLGVRALELRYSLEDGETMQDH